jgi:hypothetical protein
MTDAPPEKLLPHLSRKDGKWKVYFHRDYRAVIWSDPLDFADACRYMKLIWPSWRHHMEKKDAPSVHS